MPDKLMYPIGSFKYGTRRLMAGDDPVLMNARDQRLYMALGKVSADEPKGSTSDGTNIRQDMADAEKTLKKAAARKPAANKRTTRKRKTKAKA